MMSRVVAFFRANRLDGFASTTVKPPSDEGFGLIEATSKDGLVRGLESLPVDCACASTEMRMLTTTMTISSTNCVTRLILIRRWLFSVTEVMHSPERAKHDSPGRQSWELVSRKDFKSRRDVITSLQDCGEAACPLIPRADALGFPLPALPGLLIRRWLLDVINN